jgi:hypothetical protein
MKGGNIMHVHLKHKCGHGHMHMHKHKRKDLGNTKFIPLNVEPSEDKETVSLWSDEGFEED